MHGVLNTWVGYTGGTQTAPTYESVCALNNTHTEALRLEFDPSVISFNDLVKRFLDDPRVRTFGHSPQLMKRAQTKIAIWAQDESQATIARRLLQEAGKAIPVLPSSHFHYAEDYHQHHISEEKSYPDFGEADPWRDGSWGL